MEGLATAIQASLFAVSHLHTAFGNEPGEDEKAPASAVGHETSHRSALAPHWLPVYGSSYNPTLWAQDLQGVFVCSQSQLPTAGLGLATLDISISQEILVNTGQGNARSLCAGHGVAGT